MIVAVLAALCGCDGSKVSPCSSLKHFCYSFLTILLKLLGGRLFVSEHTCDFFFFHVHGIFLKLDGKKTVVWFLMSI